MASTKLLRSCKRLRRDGDPSRRSRRNSRSALLSSSAQDSSNGGGPFEPCRLPGWADRVEEGAGSSKRASPLAPSRARPATAGTEPPESPPRPSSRRFGASQSSSAEGGGDFFGLRMLSANKAASGSTPSVQSMACRQVDHPFAPTLISQSALCDDRGKIEASAAWRSDASLRGSPAAFCTKDEARVPVLASPPSPAAAETSRPARTPPERSAV